MILSLRILLYVQFLLGAGRVFGLVANPRIWEIHLGLGFIITLLALVALGKGREANGMRTAARFMPLVTLLLGLGLYNDILTGFGFTLIHILFGVATIGVIEMVAAKTAR